MSFVGGGTEAGSSIPDWKIRRYAGSNAFAPYADQ